MRILIINYRYFISGGPEIYLFNLKKLLESKGHEVIPFSIRYIKNKKTKYSRYFVDPLSSEDEIYFKDQTWNLSSILKTLERAFYSREVYNNLIKLIHDTKPDFAIVLHYLRKLSPAVLVALKEKKIPYFVRVSDFAIICPNAHLIYKDKICELCIKRNLINSVIRRCVQDSLLASTVNYFAMKYHSYKKYDKLINNILVPSKFTLSKLNEAGIEREKLIYFPTFVPFLEKKNKNKCKKQILYFGRIEKIKGIHILLKGMKKVFNIYPDLDIKLIIAGEGNASYKQELLNIIKLNSIKGIEFVGNLNRKELKLLIQESLFSIAPSIVYDNMPNSVLESLALGTPVIASNHGSFPEIVIDGKTGLLFNPGDPEDLSKKIIKLLFNKKELKKMSENAIEFIKEKHSPEVHYNLLFELVSSRFNLRRI